MARLSLFLPSFAADYSGVCSCLFDLDALVVVADAACCTRNYIDYDEPVSYTHLDVYKRQVYGEPSRHLVLAAAPSHRHRTFGLPTLAA